MATVYTGKDGRTYTVDGNTLTVSGTGISSSITRGTLTISDNSTIDLKSTIAKAIYEQGITGIDNNAWQNCPSLTSVELPEGLTSISGASFAYTGLQTVTLPSTLTTIGSSVFATSYNIRTVIFKSATAPTIGSSAFGVGMTSTVTVTFYSYGWADSTVIDSTVLNSKTTAVFVTGVPEAYKKITLNGSKVQVDSAVRDGQGQRIDTGYQKKNIIVSNTTVSSWSSDNTYSDYPYRASIAITGVTASDTAEIVFAVAQATSGDYAPVCETYAGGVYIYSAVNDSITVPTIIIFKG